MPGIEVNGGISPFFGHNEISCGRGVNVHRLEYEAAPVKLMAHLERGHHFLFRRGDRLFAVFHLQLLDLVNAHLIALDHAGRIKPLGAHGKIRGIERQRPVYLEPRDTERHHHISDRVRFWEHVLDLFARIDVPVRHVLLVHRGFHFLGQSLALAHAFHSFERELGFDALQYQVVHDIVAAADAAGQRDTAAHQFGRVAQPHVRAVRQAGNGDQFGKRRRVGLLDHAAHELGAELGYGQAAEVARMGSVSGFRPCISAPCTNGTGSWCRDRQAGFPAR